MCLQPSIGVSSRTIKHKQQHGHDGQQAAAGAEHQSRAEEELAPDVYDCIGGARYVQASADCRPVIVFYLLLTPTLLCIRWFGSAGGACVFI